MQVDIKKVTTGTMCKDIPHNSCCTFARWGHNAVCMRVKSDQENVRIVIKKGSTGSADQRKIRMLDLNSGHFYLVTPWEPATPIDVKVVEADSKQCNRLRGHCQLRGK